MSLVVNVALRHNMSSGYGEVFTFYLFSYLYVFRTGLFQGALINLRFG